MRRGGLVAVALLALLLAPGAVAWSQFHGGPDRNGRAALPGGPMDIVRVLDTPEAYTNSFWGSRALPTPEGLVLLEDTDDGCQVLVVARPYQEVTRRVPVRDCNFGIIVGYDPATDLLVMCDNSALTFPTMRAMRLATGEIIWTVIPDRDLSPAAGTSRWVCFGAAIDAEGRRFAAGFEGYGPTGGLDHLIAMGDLDSGQLLWRAKLPAQPGTIPLDMGVAPEAYPRPLYPRGITITTTGVVATVYVGCGPAGVNPGACLEEGAVAWYSLDGSFGGAEFATKPEAVEPSARSPTARPHAVSQYAVASGPIAAIGLGTEVLVINPEAAAPVQRAPLAGVEPTSRSTFWFPGAWTESLVLMPILSSITALDPVTLQPVWSFTEGLEWRLVDTLSTTGGETYVLFTNMVDPDFRLVVLQTATGEVIRRLPVPGRLPEADREGGWYAHLVPLEGDGLAIVDLSGRVVLLGPADARGVPDISLSNAYPAPGEEVTLDIRASGEPSILIHWGDGSDETLDAPGVARHLFAQRGDRDVAITAVRPDGTTATRIATIHVGGTAPAELTALQRAFSPEYQNWTFFILGTLITIVGLAVTVGRNRRRFSKLERELAAVEEIRMLSVADPRAAVLALKSYRDRLPEDLARRRIDDSQYQILDLRSARLLKVLRTRLFSPFDARMSPRYHRLVDAAFEDAILQPSEKLALLAALDAEESLSEIDRQRIATILDDFTSVRSGH